MAAAHRPLVVFCADSPWYGHRLAAQHIAERLTRYADVLYVEQPRSPVGRLRHRSSDPAAGAWRPGPQAVPGVPGLHRLSPLVTPGKTRPGGRAFAGALARAQVRRAAHALAPAVHAVVQVPVHFPFLGCCGEPRRVHLASDDFVAAAAQNGVEPGWVGRAEARTAAAATTVIAVSEVLAERWRRLGVEPIVVPNGCDVNLYAHVEDLPPVPGLDLRPPVAGFIGTLSDRTDTSLLTALADAGCSLLLVGPRSFTAPNPELDALFARPDVVWTGPKPYTEVPRYLRHVDVGLVPYRLDDFNRASFPLKALDYLAAGLPVVATDIPALAAVGEDVVTIVHDPEEFVAAVHAQAAVAHDPAAMARRRARAREHSWDRRVADLARALDLAD